MAQVKGWAINNPALLSSAMPTASIRYSLAQAWKMSRSPEAGAHTAAAGESCEAAERRAYISSFRQARVTPP